MGGGVQLNEMLAQDTDRAELAKELTEELDAVDAKCSAAKVGAQQSTPVASVAAAKSCGSGTSSFSAHLN